ncbi:hypothetical protein H9Y04_29705 [Streptomyces sp. TRM66268-LWL]|uniref:Integral membrane protein n=1 Tax=Streptomyces polyasparticus TaxID=2767826 RepID=A0ABR7SP25_9ACTN|nr:hypothetical protein [Streptomyces polyasparticus]MBC9716717.1 hypothetical protein [Streptomyces polyasparticus]
MEDRDAELKKELQATLHTRRELGEDYEPALVESFLKKVEDRLDATVDRRMRRLMAEQQMAVAREARSPRGSADAWGERFGFAIVSLILAIPLSAIAAVNADLPGLIVAWLGIVGVNAVHAMHRFPQFGRSRRARGQDSDWED